MKVLDLMQAIMTAKPELSFDEVEKQAENMFRRAAALEKKLLAGDKPDDTDKKEKPILTKVFKKSDFVFKTPENAITDAHVKCCICGKEKQSLTAKHLAGHGTTKENYLISCGYPPDTKLMTKSMLEASIKRVKVAQKANTKNKPKTAKK